jgi:hypothetical protein
MKETQTNANGMLTAGIDFHKRYSVAHVLDIEEMDNLAASMPEKAEELDALLQNHLDEMQASPPYLSPSSRTKLFGKDQIPTALKHSQKEGRVSFRFRENGAKVVIAHLLYADNGGDRYEEWYRVDARVVDGNPVVADLPAGATHYVFNLIDENHYLVSYAEMNTQGDTSGPFSERAFVVEYERGGGRRFFAVGRGKGWV